MASHRLDCVSPPKRQMATKDNEITCDAKLPRNEGVADSMIAILDELCLDLVKFDAGSKVSHIYNPVEYASNIHEQFIRRYCSCRKDVLFLGMNPGPFGMAQTGVPFGEVNYVKDWMKLNGIVKKPSNEHPKRPIEGLKCKRSEVSGARLWGLVKEHFQTPETFFKKAYVYNYCPLVFMNETGKNVVPGSITLSERRKLFECCDKALLHVIHLLKVKVVVGIGKFCYDKAKQSLKDSDTISVTYMMHPSPASPAANKNWAGIALKQLKDSGVWKMLF